MLNLMTSIQEDVSQISASWTTTQHV